MTDTARESRLTVAFVKLADTLTADFNLLDLLDVLVHQCVEIFDCDAGGLLLADSEGQLRMVASTSGDAKLVELMQLGVGKGPCIDCFTTGEPVTAAGADELRERWADFADAAVESGFQAVHATPLRLRGQVLGAMNLFSTRNEKLNDRDIAAARALTDIATIGILQERLVRKSTLVTEQLQFALDSRVLIEQAKGIIAVAHGIPIDEAFTRLRDYSRNNQISLRAVAESITTRSLDPMILTRREGTSKPRVSR